MYAKLCPCQLPFFVAGLLVALAGVGALVPGPHIQQFGRFAVLLITGCPPDIQDWLIIGSFRWCPF